MEVCVLTRDLMFFSAVEGVAGAMGHRARQAESLAEVGKPDLLIVDLGQAAFAPGDIALAFDPLRTAIFAPHVQVETFNSARASGFAHVYRRGALAIELPRLLSEYRS